MQRSILLCLPLVLAAHSARAASPGDVVINEVCWMGSMSTSAGYDDEWIELYNNTGQAVDLSGWNLVDDVDEATYALAGTIEANGYFLIEKREEATSVTADLIVPELSLNDAGDSLELTDDDAVSIDFLDTHAGWYAGTINAAGVQDISMERRNPDVPGDITTNWADNDGTTVNGSDSEGNPLVATPRAQNSVFGTFVSGAAIVHVHNQDLSAVDVTFSEALDPTSAGDPAHYSFSGGIQPAAASLDAADPTIVHLTGISGLTAEELVVLSVDGVETAAGVPSLTSAELVAGIAGCAFVRTDVDTSFVPDLIEQHPDAFVTVQGVLTSAGDFDGRDGRLQDASGGLSLWDPQQDLLGLATRWDELRVSGQLAQYNGLDQLTNLRGEVLGQTGPVAPVVLTLDEIASDPEGYENMLVGVAGISDTGNGDAWPATDQAASLEVSDGGTASMGLFIDSDTDIDGSDEPSWPVDVVGIFSQYDTTDPRDEDYTIQPRDLDDLGGELCSPDGSQRSCYTGPPGTVGVGVCQEGTQTCLGGVWGACEGEVVPAASDDDCDGQDDDCDDATDEDVDLQTNPEHCGACGVACGPDEACVDGTCVPTTCQDADGDGYGIACDAGPDCDDADDQVYPGAPELCDEVDNDCDDQTDENWPELGEACDGDDDDLCQNGHLDCNPEQDGTTCVESIHKTEVCNAEDDDCDDEVDEDWPIGEPCDGPDDDGCANGVYQCNRSGTGITCDEEPGSGILETCNGQDDDCDGETDELDPATITCGAGVCEVTIQRCLNGQLQECIPNRSAPEYQEIETACEDGLDNDCDGFIDMTDANCRGGGDGGGCGCNGTTGSAGSADIHPAILLALLGLIWLARKTRSPCG